MVTAKPVRHAWQTTTPLRKAPGTCRGYRRYQPARHHNYRWAVWWSCGANFGYESLLREVPPCVPGGNTTEPSVSESTVTIGDGA